MTSPRPPRRRARKDISIVMATRKWRENPGFVETAVALGHCTSCEETTCGKIIGVGLTRSESVQDVLDNQTGNWYEGIGQPRNDGWRCVEHSYAAPMVPTSPPAA